MTTAEDNARVGIGTAEVSRSDVLECRNTPGQRPRIHTCSGWRKPFQLTARYGAPDCVACMSTYSEACDGN